MKHNFKTLFLLRRGKTKADNTTPIYVRISLDSKRIEFSTGIYVDADKWCSIKGRLKGNTESVRSQNAQLELIQTKANETYYSLCSSSKMINIENFRYAYLGENQEKRTLLEVFEFHNENMEKLVGKEFSKSTLTKYKTSYKHVKEFIANHFKRTDVYLEDLNHAFITQFDYFLRAEKNIENNCTVKYLTHLRKVIRLALSNEWMVKDPFVNFKMQVKETERPFLNEEEIYKIKNAEIEIDRLNQVRDVFLFCCFTGYAFIDVYKLTTDNLVRGIDGEWWIHTKRTKTDTRSNVMLLPEAKAILHKYKKYQDITGRLLPVSSNQKMNAYLKEIAVVAKINKTLTMHVARHTFATYALTNNVPLETVSSLLGHKSLKTTQHYAKIIDKKIVADMQFLKNKQSEVVEEIRKTS